MLATETERVITETSTNQRGEDASDEQLDSKVPARMKTSSRVKRAKRRQPVTEREHFLNLQSSNLSMTTHHFRIITCNSTKIMSSGSPQTRPCMSLVITKSIYLERKLALYSV